VSAPRDPGLQPERTRLAWRRTLLAVAAGSLLALRVLEPLLGVGALAVGAAGLAAAGVLWMLVGRRHRAVEAVFRGAVTDMPGGALLLALALLATAAAALGLALALLP